MENVTMITFDVESEAFQAFSELKNDSVNSAYTILQMAVLENQDGKIVAKDGFDSGSDSTNMLWGTLIGGLIGILAGPLGVLLGGSLGLLAGSIVDASNVEDDSSMIDYASDQLAKGKAAIVALVQEEDTKAFDLRLHDYQCSIKRWDAAEISEEVEHAEEVQRQLAKEAKEKMREQRREERKKRVEEKRTEIRQKFDEFMGKTN